MFVNHSWQATDYTGFPNLSTSSNSNSSPSPSDTRDEPKDPKTISCQECRTRKIKCDRKFPCDSCAKAGIECHPATRRARAKRDPRKKQKELHRRLDQLEALLGTLQTESGPAERPKEPEPEPEPRGSHADCPVSSLLPVRAEASNDTFLGKPFYNSLGKEISGIRQLLDDDALDEEDVESPGASHKPVPFLGGCPYLKPLQPSPAHFTILVQTFFECVDGLFKILHRPTAEKMIVLAYSDLDRVHGSPIEALMFSVYFAAITCIEEHECQQLFSKPRDELLTQYRTGVETALTNADYLSNTDMTCLQALTIFLCTVRASDVSRYSWTMMGVAVRLAHAFGLNRESAGKDLPPFQIELRRRLWWALCGLDARASDDRATDPMILDNSFDTHFPLNINDDDMSPEMTEFPPGRLGVTDMFGSCLGLMFARPSSELNFVSPLLRPEDVYKVFDVSHRENIVKNLYQRVREGYLVHLDERNPYHTHMLTVVQLIFSRLWLSVYYPLQPNHHIKISKATQDRMFQAAVRVLELASNLYNEDPRVRGGRMKWISTTYIHWHAMAIALANLCVRERGPEVDKAWQVVDEAYHIWSERVADTKSGALWRPISKLRTAAQKVRMEAQAADFALASKVPLTQSQEIYSMPTFELLPLNMFQPESQPIPQEDLTGNAEYWQYWNEFVMEI